MSATYHDVTSYLQSRASADKTFVGLLFSCTLLSARKGQTKLEFITEDYHYPGAYDTDGKVILEKGATISNELHRTDAQTERACT